MAQIINITSEALQATIRRLLPSQQGFGEDLQATNVVTPIIDLTPTAEGSILPSYLQSALSTDESIATTENTTQTIASTPGFYRVRIRILGTSATAGGQIRLNETSSGTNIELFTTGGADTVRLNNEFICFVRTGYTLQARSDAAGFVVQTLVTQVADVNGVLSDPQGFTSE